MGVLEEFSGHLSPLCEQFSRLSTVSQVGITVFGFITLSVVFNVLRQILFKNPNEPPLVFHWFPIIGSTITYGMDPPTFFHSMRAKYGDIFTFILLGKRVTVTLGPQGNDYVLGGKHTQLAAEDVYSVRSLRLQ